MKNFDDDDSVEMDSVVSEEKEKESFRNSFLRMVKKSNSMHIDELKIGESDYFNSFNITEQIEKLQK